ncbi:MAG: GTPase Era [Gammaproteobacteria bacterium]
MSQITERCGFAAIVGRPNVGKSTLLNRILGKKISIVTPKPQTTRHRILGVKAVAETQILFVDTPGLQLKGKRAIDRVMNRNSVQSMNDADVVVFICEFGSWKDLDENVLRSIKTSGRPALAVINKIDKAPSRVALLPELQKLSERMEFDAIFPMSALSGDNMGSLVEYLGDNLPEGPWLYPEDADTDKDDRFRVAEIVREKLMMELQQELPYGLAVEIETWEVQDEQVSIAATIWLDRESQKPILIGKNGERLKKIGTSARRDVIKLLGGRVHLQLWAKTRKNWSDDARLLKSLGYESQ